MNKKLICGILAALMIFSSASVLAGTDKPTYIWTPGYYPGESEHLVNAEDCIFTNNASVTAGGVQINAGGSATWGFYLPYGSRSVTIKYTGGGNIVLSSDTDTYNAVSLTNGTDSEYKLEFGKNLGKDKEPQYRTWGAYGALSEYVERRGEKQITITSDEGISIKELRFEKELTMGPPSTAPIPKFSDDEDVQRYSIETTSTVLMHENASAIVVNGGTRYLDNNDTQLKPLFVNGSVYLPINTLAKALGYYHEVIAEKDYVLMRSDTHEVVKMNGSCKVTEGLSQPTEAPGDVIINHNGRVWAAVRFFGELLGETVGYKDGLIAIDDKYTVRDILEEEGFYNFALAKFAEFTEPADTEIEGNIYYVAQNDVASDSNSGSAMAPFKTLAKAASVATAGDTVIVREGTYREVLAPQNDGTATAPITFKAAEGERVVISANEPLGKPALYDEEKGVYIFGMNFDMGLGRNQVFIDGELQTEARYPDAPGHITTGKTLSNAWGVRADLIKASGDGDAFKVGGAEWQKYATELQKKENKATSYETVNTEYESADYDAIVSDMLLDQEDNYWQGGMYVGIFSNGYAVNNGLIESSTKGKLIISDEYRQQRWWWRNWANSLTINKETNDQWNWGMIVGHKNAMNLPGEWVKPQDEDRMYMILPDGADPKTVNVEAKARMLVADLTGRKYINIEGFETIGGSVIMKNSKMCMLNGMNMRYISHYTISSDQRNGYIDFPYYNAKEGAPQRGEMGIFISGSDNIITNSRIDHSAAAAVYMTGLYTYLENNIMNDCGYMGAYVSGIHADTQAWDHVTVPRGGFAIYNNTVYNTGRGALDFGKNEYYKFLNGPESQVGHGNAPFLACDIAYNDFHDACLLTQDAGAIYTNATNASIDKSHTTVRNNYVYKTTQKPDGNHYDILIYWDGNAHGYDTFENLAFLTGDTHARMKLFQGVDGVEAYCREWNNQYLGNIELDDTIPVADALSDEYFSEERPFFAGAQLDRETPYMNNYRRFESEKYNMEHRAQAAKVSEGVTVDAEDGFAKFSNDGQYIEFSDVDFGDGANEMIINFRSLGHWTFDKLEVTVGQSMESGKKYDVEIPQSDAPGIEQANTLRFLIDDTYGKNNVWIKVKDYFSVEIGGISVFKRTRTDKTEEFSNLTYLASYTDRIAGAGAQPDFFIGDSSLATKNPYINGVKSTWTGNTVRFANRTIEAESDYFVLAAGSRDQYLGQLIRVYVCEPTEEFVKPTGEPVAEIRTLNQGFYDVTPIKVPLLKEVKAGKYDIYLDFVYEGKGKTSNMTYFGFIKKGADSSAIASEARYQGGRWDKTISVDNPDRPFEYVRYDRVDALRKLMFALPGTTAGYSNVRTLAECSRMTINYYVTDEEHAGQPISIRIEDADKNVVATASIVTAPCEPGVFTEGIAQLSNPVPSGTYTVYLEFGGDANSNKACQIGWFRFEK